jgi:hypothetical protein
MGMNVNQAVQDNSFVILYEKFVLLPTHVIVTMIGQMVVVQETVHNLFVIHSVIHIRFVSIRGLVNVIMDG